MSSRSVGTALLPAALTVLLALVPLAANAQQSNSATMPGMNHTTLGTISGKDHPEMIPDSTAYRLYFLVIGELPNASDQRLARQNAFVSKSGIQASDSGALIEIADLFKARFTAMVNDYNAKVEAANENGTALPDAKAFLAQRDELVGQARALLKESLSASGMSKLDAHVQSEKHHMTVTAPQEVGQ